MLRRTLLLCFFAMSGFPQEPAPAPEEEKLEFVSGTVVELQNGKIVVNREVPGKPAEHRAFLITNETKVEGTLKVQVRVTVGFKPTDTGEPAAVRIIVRQSQKAKP
jgi:hypothetical protein